MSDVILNVRDNRAILKSRAKMLACPLAAPEADGETLEVVEFLLAGERYGIESLQVREVYALRDLTPLPCAPPFVLGIVNCRGQILSVIDLRRVFDFSEKGLTETCRIIIAEAKGAQVGLLADEILGIRRLRLDALQPALPTLTGTRADYLKGLTSDHMVVLDVTRILADPRIAVDADART